MLSERQVKQQLRELKRLLVLSTSEWKRRHTDPAYLMERGLLFGAWLAYRSMLQGEKK